MQEKVIQSLIHLGKEIDKYINNNKTAQNSKFHQIIKKTETSNPWFIERFIIYALKNISSILKEENIRQFVHDYKPKYTSAPKKVAIIMAGNIPLVGFLDFLHILLTGHNIIVKLSRNDMFLLPTLSEILCSFLPDLHKKIEFTFNVSSHCDAVVATGSNNTARYFEYHFRHIPHIIRKNRSSCAVLTGKESNEDLHNLSDDMFLYFGFGCRNVSKLFVPFDFDLYKIIELAYKYSFFSLHEQYINNYTFNKAQFVINSTNFIDGNFFLMTHSNEFHSPHSVIFYEKYKELEVVKKILDSNRDQIQCVVSGCSGLDTVIRFGQSQSPSIDDFADNVNVIDFLNTL